MGGERERSKTHEGDKEGCTRRGQRKDTEKEGREGERWSEIKCRKPTWNVTRENVKMSCGGLPGGAVVKGHQRLWVHTQALS